MEPAKRPRSGKTFNPFYVLLLIVGTTFAITACAYGVMTVQMLRMGQTSITHTETPAVDLADLAEVNSGMSLLQFLDTHGFQLMMWQLGILAVATAAAIGTDEFWSYRAAAAERQASRSRQ